MNANEDEKRENNMDLRKEFGGKIEEALNKAVDEHLSAAVLLPLVEGVINSQLEKVKHMIKADVIDQIDGEDDIK